MAKIQSLKKGYTSIFAYQGTKIPSCFYKLRHLKVRGEKKKPKAKPPKLYPLTIL